jgi:hypothetical protein
LWRGPCLMSLWLLSLDGTRTKGQPEVHLSPGLRREATTQSPRENE